MKWTKAIETEVGLMFGRGESASVIARKFKTTRSTILGKLRRLGPTGMRVD